MCVCVYVFACVCLCELLKHTCGVCEVEMRIFVGLWALQLPPPLLSAPSVTVYVQSERRLPEGQEIGTVDLAHRRLLFPGPVCGPLFFMFCACPPASPLSLSLSLSLSLAPHRGPALL